MVRNITREQYYHLPTSSTANLYGSSLRDIHPTTTAAHHTLVDITSGMSFAPLRLTATK